MSTVGASRICTSRERVAKLAAQLVGSAAHIDRQVEFVIIGGGVIGVATAYHLSTLHPGLRIILLESDGLGSNTGSSYGDSRMYREVYSSEYCSKMQTEALKLWQELETKCSQQLLQRHGLLFYGDTDTGETVQGSLLACQAIAEQRQLSHRLHSTAQELNQQYPLNAKEGYQGLFEDGAGSINAKEAVNAMLHLAKQAGLEVLQHEGLAGVTTPALDQVVVTTTKGRRIRAKQMCLTAGAWTNEVLTHLHMQFPLEIWKVHWGHYYIDPALQSSIPQWYKFGRIQPDSHDEGLYYGFPPQSSEPVVKVGVDFAPCARRCRMQSMQDFDYTPDHVVAQLLDDFLKTEWKGFLKQKDLCCSPYTMTSDGMFILDHLPDHPQICLFTGGNGRAFKFSILLGRCLADLLLDRKPIFDIKPLSATRDAVRPFYVTAGAPLAGSSS